MNGDSSPLTAAIDASSISANPSNVGPDAIFSAAEVRLGVGLQVGVGSARADLDRPLGERERRLGVARPRGDLAAQQREIAVRVRLAVGTEDPLGAAQPGRGDRRLSRVAVLAGDVEREIRGAELVALRLVGLEGALLGIDFDLAMRGEERGERQCLEVGARQLAGAIGLGQPLERLRPRVTDQASRPARSGSASIAEVGGLTSLMPGIVPPLDRSPIRAATRHRRDASRS